MNEREFNLEAELTAMRPKTPPPALLDQMLAAMHPAPRQSNRLLLCAIGAGALAACTIISIITQDQATHSGQPSPSIVHLDASHPSDQPTVLARANPGWADGLK